MVCDSHTGVGLALLDIASIPLADARTASVRQNNSTNLFKGSHLTVALDGRADLFRAGGNREFALGRQSVFVRLSRDGCGAGHVLVRRVGAGTNETDLQLGWPPILLNSLLKFGYRGSEIGSERSVDVRLELVEVLIEA